MDYERERYVRVYTRDTTEWTDLTFEQQALWLMLLRKADRSGRIDLGARGRARIGSAIGHKEQNDALQPALDAILELGWVTLEAGGTKLLIPNFERAQETSSSGAKRTAEWRARQRDKQAKRPDGAPSPEPVTKRHADETNRHESVTSGDGARRGVTRGDSVPCRAVPKPPQSPVGGSDGMGRGGFVEQDPVDPKTELDEAAAIGRDIDPSADLTDAERRAAEERVPNAPPSVKSVVELLNEHSSGAFFLVVDSASRSMLEARITELHAAHGFGLDAYAVLALWAAKDGGNGVAWSKSALSPAWLRKGSNLADALSQAAAWWLMVRDRRPDLVDRKRAALGHAPRSRETAPSVPEDPRSRVDVRPSTQAAPHDPVPSTGAPSDEPTAEAPSNTPSRPNVVKPLRPSAHTSPQPGSDIETSAQRVRKDRYGAGHG